jgi:hypothetical protein
MTATGDAMRGNAFPPTSALANALSAPEFPSIEAILILLGLQRASTRSANAARRDFSDESMMRGCANANQLDLFLRHAKP